MSEDVRKKVVDVAEIKKGGYIMEDNEAFRVTEIAHSKAGKHGHGKYRIDGTSITSNRKVSVVKGSGHKIDVPIIDKHTAQVLTIEERTKTTSSKDTITVKFANVMDVDSYETFDMEIPDDVTGVVEGVKVIYWDVLGMRMIRQLA